MPKLKSRSSAKKRFKLTATGLVKAKAAYKSHYMRNRSQNMKRTARGYVVLSPSDAKLIKTYFWG